MNDVVGQALMCGRCGVGLQQPSGAPGTLSAYTTLTACVSPILVMCGLFILVEIEQNVVNILFELCDTINFAMIKYIFQLNMFCVNFVIQTKHIFTMKKVMSRF